MAPKIDIPISAPTLQKIEITKLPKEVQSKMLIFDKDNNGYIDSKNKQGINEIELLKPYAKKIGLDLSKYTYSIYHMSDKNIDIDNNDTRQTRTEYRDNDNHWRFESYENGELVNNGEYVRHKDGTNSGTQKIVKSKQVLTTGKYSLSLVDIDIFQDDITTKTTKAKEYQINGETVQAKAVGRGRYLITTEKGETFYISHDGFKLKNSYVESNP